MLLMNNLGRNSNGRMMLTMGSVGHVSGTEVVVVMGWVLVGWVWFYVGGDSGGGWWVVTRRKYGEREYTNWV